MTNYVPGEEALIEHLQSIDALNSGAAPFRESPYSEDIKEDEIVQDNSGISVSVDERTFGKINANMGTFVKGAAKDWRGMVNGAAKFVQNSIKKTLRPKVRPPKVTKNVKGGGGLLGLFGLLPDKNKAESSSYGSSTPPMVSTANPTYGIPTVTPAYGAPTSTASASYGVPSASVITSEYEGATGPITNYGTNFNDIGPSIQSLHKPPTTTPSPVNPFLNTTPHSNTVTTPFSDTIFRSKRKRPPKKRPGTPPPQFFQSTTPSPRPSIVTTFRTKTPKPTNNHVKDHDLQEVKLAWYKYYKKAANYVHKYKEKIDVKQFKRSFESPSGINSAKKPRPRKYLKPGPSTPGPHPIPFSGQVLRQLPFKARTKKPTKLPFFTVPRPSGRPPPRPPTLRPTLMRRKPSLNFLESTRRDHSHEMDALHDTIYYDYVIDDGIFTSDYHQDEDNTTK